MLNIRECEKRGETVMHRGNGAGKTEREKKKMKEIDGKIRNTDPCQRYP